MRRVTSQTTWAIVVPGRRIDRGDIKNYIGQEHFEIALRPDTESIVAGFENNPISN